MVKKSTTIDTKLMDILTLFVLHGKLVQKRLNFKKCPEGNFPKLADWAVHGRSLFLAALGAEIFKQGTILLHYPVYVACRVQVPPISVL